jgi:uncharacterized protein YuzE
MNIKYFQDTDTALLEFSANTIFETVEVGEDIYIDIDERHGLVSMTIEHAKANGVLDKLVYEEVKSRTA